MNRVQSRESRVESQTRGSRTRGLLLLTHNPQPSTLNPSGATLAEILISLMVMGIGVTSLALLISTSVLRSIQASQLTNATIHRLNAEQIITLFPRIVHDPDADADLAEHETGIVDNPADAVNEGRFIVDPLGATNANFVVAVRDNFGNNAGAAPANPIKRYNGGFTTTSTAGAAAYLADTWQTAARGIPTASSTTSITAPGNIDLTDARNAVSAGLAVRAVLFTGNGRYSYTRDGLTIDATARTVTWTDALPTGTVSRFRIEIYEPRYSWLLTVRKTPGAVAGQGSANVDVVIFHKRGFNPNDEQIYTTTLTKGSSTCTITVPGTTKPFLKKGGYLFDAQHANWYRIVKLTEGTNPVVELNRPAVQSTTRLMAMPGIVEIYPIGTVPFDPTNTP